MSQPEFSYYSFPPQKVDWKPKHKSESKYTPFSQKHEQ